MGRYYPNGLREATTIFIFACIAGKMGTRFRKTGNATYFAFADRPWSRNLTSKMSGVPGFTISPVLRHKTLFDFDVQFLII
jgi:hypothetical protein